MKNLLVFVFLVFSAVSAGAKSINAVGFKKIDVIDPVNHKPMQAVAFFPGNGAAGSTIFGPYQVTASRQVTIGEDVYPLILLSHGSMGSLLGHHDFATQLAEQGYIVVSLTHPGDNFQDPSLTGTSSTLYGRPLQISAALSAALGDPELGKHTDKNRIGFLGFSAGGTTGLILAGAKPDISRLIDYCATRINDHHVCEAKGNIRIEHPELVPSPDPRIKSFVLLAPLSVVFSPEELKSLNAPLLVFVGNKDEELSPDENAISLAKETKATLKMFPDAGHFTFLPPCSPEMARDVPDICSDNQGVDRVSVHHEINKEMTAFFNDSLSRR